MFFERRTQPMSDMRFCELNDNRFQRTVGTNNGYVMGITEAYGSKSKSLVVVLRYPLGHHCAADCHLSPIQANQFARAIADAYRSTVPVISAINTKDHVCLNVISGGDAQPYVEIAGTAPGAPEPVRLEFSEQQAGLLVCHLLNCIGALMQVKSSNARITSRL